MDLQSILAAILNPNGTQQAQPMAGAQQINDHSSAALPFQQPPQMQQQPMQAPQMPQQQGMPQQGQLNLRQ